MAAAKTKTTSSKSTTQEPNGMIYDSMLKELQGLAKSSAQAKKVEDSVLNEARGREAWVLHTILRAISEHDGASLVRAKETQAAISKADKNVSDSANTNKAHFEKTWKQELDTRKDIRKVVSELETATQENFGASRDLAEENHKALVKALQKARSDLDGVMVKSREAIVKAIGGVDNNVGAESKAIQKAVQEATKALTAEVDGTENNLVKRMNEVHDESTQAITQFRQAMEDQVKRFLDNTVENFESTNRRVRTEIGELNDHVTSVMDKRFNHIDQTFASVRGDLEVVKALVMELIKERVGRPEIVRN